VARARNNNITDAGLEHLGKMTNLPGVRSAAQKSPMPACATRGPDAHEAPVLDAQHTGDALKHLSAMKERHTLDLSFTQVGDGGLAILPFCRTRCSILSGTKITGRGMETLVKFRGLIAGDASSSPWCRRAGSKGCAHNRPCTGLHENFQIAALAHRRTGRN